MHKRARSCNWSKLILNGHAVIFDSAKMLEDYMKPDSVLVGKSQNIHHHHLSCSVCQC